MDTHSSSLNQAARVQEPSTTASNSRLRRTLVHPERLFKVVIVGDSAVGKSSLINRFCRGHFVSSFNATIGMLEFCEIFLWQIYYPYQAIEHSEPLNF